MTAGGGTFLGKWGKVRPLDPNALVFPTHVSANPSHLFEIDHAR